MERRVAAEPAPALRPADGGRDDRQAVRTGDRLMKEVTR